MERTDVVIVGAGISGISAAWHLQKHCPNHSYTILEGRKGMGGTWDLFRYPGIRSDSDMHTMGFSFKPWTEPKVISDGHLIRKYIKDTADESDISGNIRFEHKLTGASWSSEDSAWTLTMTSDGKKKKIQCNFLHMCNGYYNYDEGYLPKFPGYADFKGTLVHPQQWPENLNYKGKKVVIIGSGATGVTLLPALAETAAHVTMLQRSPTYMVSRPSIDPISAFLNRFLPIKWAYRLTRAKNILLQILFFQTAKRSPEKVKEQLLGELRTLLDEETIQKHFIPSYNPWDQRMCLVPDADFFHALNSGKASMATDHIERFTEKGIQLKSGQHLDADIIITATGLQMQLLQDIDFSVDGTSISIPDHIIYKGAMLSDMPNMVFTMGYSNASWTLKADLTASWACRLLKYMRRKGYSKCVPLLTDTDVTPESVMNLSSGYVTRSIGRVPKQGSKAPWRLRHNYIMDRIILGLQPMQDATLDFSRSPKKAPAEQAEEMSKAA